MALFAILPTLKVCLGNSLAVQWLGVCACTARGMGSIPGWGTKIPRAVQRRQKKKKKFAYSV